MTAAVGAVGSVGVESDAGGRRGIRLRDDPVDPLPDEPTAVVVAGGGRAALLDALLGSSGPAPDVPASAYLVVQPGLRVAAWAYLPGARLPQPYDLAGPRSGGFVRPPRRLELSLPDPLLRHFTLIRAPDMSTLDVAGSRILLDVVRRAGALVYAGDGGQDLVARVAESGAAVFRALPGGAAGDRAFDAGPGMADIGGLRRALVEWAGAEALARASANPPMLPGAYGTVRVADGAHESGWAERLDRACVAAARTVRQRLAIELANVHLRGTQEIVFGVGSAGLPDVLDREMHAVSLRAVAECDAAVDRILDDALTQVLGEIPSEGVRRRVALAVRHEVTGEGDVANPARVLLVTSTAGVATIVGTGAVTALAAYRDETDRALLPPLGVGLSGACYQHWAAPDRADQGNARTWLQQAVRGVELELLSEVSRRFEAVRHALNTLLTDAVDHGILLA
ncbi:hypothetical protein RB614_09440 [Phytohabitans sp. ZYX-F-186]|uniref:Uncharacterized protein n=1 Tax=Phytohabitans maris TaxID=3071409 RepID=A0ABU0ZCG0_9ACTN|nr:hypothetical protein [Phytohabitans sp. ZYX-F-186]MDQ7904741.1 hypothetical protein [Phytohabitans sp. ZYX-F-186]